MNALKTAVLVAFVANSALAQAAVTIEGVWQHVDLRSAAGIPNNTPLGGRATDSWDTLVGVGAFLTGGVGASWQSGPVAGAAVNQRVTFTQAENVIEFVYTTSASTFSETRLFTDAQAEARVSLSQVYDVVVNEPGHVVTFGLQGVSDLRSVSGTLTVPTAYASSAINIPNGPRFYSGTDTQQVLSDGTGTLELPVGRYSLRVVTLSSSEANSFAAVSGAGTSLGYVMSVAFSDATLARGATEDTPQLPDRTRPAPPPTPGTPPEWMPGRPGFEFDNPRTGAWYDPEVAAGYDIQTTGSLLVTAIMGFPTGFDAPFEVWVGNSKIGVFDSTSAVDFLSVLGRGVSGFQVRGLVPGTDPQDPTAFPIQLAFSGSGTLVMTPVGVTLVPEPTSFGMVACGAIILAGARRRMSRHRSRAG